MATIETEPQHLRALRGANHVRTTNAAAIKALKARTRRDAMLTVAELLRRGDMKGPAGALQVYRTLTAIRHIDEARAGRLLTAAQVFDPARSLRRLSMRQRLMLAGELEAAAASIRER